MSADGLAAIRDEVERVEESCRYSAQNQFEQAKIWRNRGYLLSVPAAILAAIAGATGLAVAASRIFAAFLALISAGFVAANGALNYGRRVDQAQVSANAYLALQQDARILRDIDLPRFDYDQARQALHELVARQQEVNTTSPVPSGKARNRAQKNISSGGQSYEVDAGSSEGA